MNRNPCLTVDPPEMPVGNGPRSLTKPEARPVIQVAVGRANSARWSVGLALGLRQG